MDKETCTFKNLEQNQAHGNSSSKYLLATLL